MERTRNYAFDILRILATICIVFHHYQQVTGAYFENRINFCNGRFYFGYVVEFFFLLSGFFMYHYIKKIFAGMTFRDFILPRLIRLLPLVLLSGIFYEICLGIYKLLYGEDWFGIKITIWGVIINALGIQDGWVFQNPCVNNVTWYVSVLILCYVTFYIATCFGKNLKIPCVYLYIFIILLGCGVQTYGINLPFFNQSSARGYYSFFTGILLAMYLKKHEVTKKSVVGSTGIIIGFISILVLKSEWIENGVNYLVTFLVYPAVLMCFSWEPLHGIFKHKYIGKLGKITYDVYIWHNVNFVVMYIIIKILNLNINLYSYKTMVIYAIIQFVVGYLSYHIIEKPLYSFWNKKYIR